MILWKLNFEKMRNFQKFNDLFSHFFEFWILESHHQIIEDHIFILNVFFIVKYAANLYS